MPNHAPAVQGSQAIQAYYQAEAEQGKTELSVTGEETIISGDWAFDRGKFTIKLTTASGTVEDQGKYIVLLSRQADGSWKVARLIFNSDLPMPGAPPAGAAGAEPKDAPAKR
jgi:ketosteroid isomerase-like protein